MGDVAAAHKIANIYAQPRKQNEAAIWKTRQRPVWASEVVIMDMRPLFIAMATCIAAAAQAEEAYLFSYFSDREFGGRSGESAGLHLAYSYDGLKWTALNDDKPLLVPEVGKDRLMRDPSICRGPDGTFHWSGRRAGTTGSSATRARRTLSTGRSSVQSP